MGPLLKALRIILTALSGGIGQNGGMNLNLKAKYPLSHGRNIVVAGG